MQIHYLEIVTPDVDAVCASYAATCGAVFGEPIPEFGQARTAALANGGTLAVRLPLREDEAPVVRPYVLVDDLAGAVADAQQAGGELALAPTQIPGRGCIAIYLQGGVEHALWQR